MTLTIEAKKALRSERESYPGLHLPEDLPLASKVESTVIVHLSTLAVTAKDQKIITGIVHKLSEHQPLTLTEQTILALSNREPGF